MLSVTGTIVVLSVVRNYSYVVRNGNYSFVVHYGNYSCVVRCQEL